MQIAVEISLYPLQADYIPPIQDFIDRLNARPGLRVVTNPLSTQVFGDHDAIFDALRAEMVSTFAQDGTAVFVTKFIGPWRAADG